MIIIKNSVNSVHELLSVPKDIGVQADVRSYGDKIIVQRDPFLPGDSLEDYMKNFSHNFLVLGIRDEGIELNVIEILEKHKISNYFLFGIHPPAAKKLMSKEFKKFAVRFSDMESIETCKLWKGKAEWLWADIFKEFSLDDKSAPALKENFKICAISPEIIGLRGAVERYRGKMNMLKIDAVCTDLPELWR